MPGKSFSRTPVNPSQKVGRPVFFKAVAGSGTRENAFGYTAGILDGKESSRVAFIDNADNLFQLRKQSNI